MTVPAFPDKHGEPAFMTPADRLVQRHGEPSAWPAVPDAVVLVVQNYLLDRVAARPDAVERDVAPTYSLYALDGPDSRVGVAGGFGVGAPAAAIVAEELVALGTDVVCVVGGCGTLQPAVSPGDVVVADRAVRDEGTSHHYLEPAGTVAATPALVAALERRGAADGRTTHTGPTWTTDGFYRETAAELAHYAGDGVLAVEMEAAAVFAVAEYRDAAAAAALVPFDRLTDDEWEWDAPTSRADCLADVLDVAADACRRALDE